MSDKTLADAEAAAAPNTELCISVKHVYLEVCHVGGQKSVYLGCTNRGLIILREAQLSVFLNHHSKFTKKYSNKMMTFWFCLKKVFALQKIAFSASVLQNI